MIKTQLVKASTIAVFAIVIVGSGVFWITHQGDSGENPQPMSGSAIYDTNPKAPNQAAGSNGTSAAELGTCSINTPCESPSPTAGATSTNPGVSTVSGAAISSNNPSTAGSSSGMTSEPATGAPGLSPATTTVNANAAQKSNVSISAVQFHDLLVKTSNEMPTLQSLARLTPEEKKQVPEQIQNAKIELQQILQDSQSDAGLEIAGHQFFVDCYHRGDLTAQLRAVCLTHARTLSEHLDASGKSHSVEDTTGLPSDVLSLAGKTN